MNGPSEAASATGPLPKTLGGVEVRSGGIPLPLFFVSPGQINFQCPAGNPGDLLSVIVHTPPGDKAPVAVLMQAATPGLYTLGSTGLGQGAVLIAGSDVVAMPEPAASSAGRPVKPGEFLEIYGNGFGATETAWAPGLQTPPGELLRVISPVRVMIGGVEVIPVFAGLTPGATGLYQINVEVPASVPSGDSIPVSAKVYLRDGSVLKTNVVTIAIAAKP